MIKWDRGKLIFSLSLSLPEWLFSRRIRDAVARWGAFRRGKSSRVIDASVEITRQ